MRTKILFVMLMLVTGAVQAHHSTNMFDNSKCITVTGTVRKLEWVYPHTWLWLEVPDSQGNAVAWGFEFMSPLQAMGLDPGWKRDVVKRGDKVTVNYAPERDGKYAGLLSSLILPSGKSLPAWPGLCGTAPH
jgi:hypothetical protein